jgi:hypothetical protein
MGTGRCLNQVNARNALAQFGQLRLPAAAKDRPETAVWGPWLWFVVSNTTQSVGAGLTDKLANWRQALENNEAHR